MLKKKIRVLLSLMLAAVLCTVSVSAALTRASAYIDWYSMNVTPVGSGVLWIEFSIEGTGKMSTLGAESITIERQSGAKWIQAAEFDRYDEGMVGTNAYTYDNIIPYNGIPETKYKVTITLFAENSSGSDSRTKTFIVTA